jgi:hypothetical protein
MSRNLATPVLKWLVPVGGCSLAVLPSLAPAFAQVPGHLNPKFYTDTDPDPSHQRDYPVIRAHQYSEDTSNTVFSLAWDFYQPEGETNPRPDALLLNAPHFDPPESVPASAGTRRFLVSSIQNRGLQLYVNYSDLLVDFPNGTTRHLQPTFFVATADDNPQPIPPLPNVGLAPASLAATRGALGEIGTSVAAHSRFPLWHEPEHFLHLGTMNALYVTAGVDVPMAEFDSASQSLAAAASLDRLFMKQGATWVDVSSKILPSATITPALATEGNSSGACFADFDGDGHLDIFVGKPGDGFTGARSRLLLYTSASGGQYIDATATNLPNLSVATVDVAAADIDNDGDQDVILANRMKRNGPAGAESVDYCLLNNGSGVFTAKEISGRLTDTRSVAVGDLDYVPGPEVVFGNAGSEGYKNELDVPTANDHPLEIYRIQSGAPTGPVFVDALSEFLGMLDEVEMSRPFTWQVLIADVCNTGPGLVDGMPDLVLVNHRDILLDAPAPSQNQPREASNIRVLANPGVNTTRNLIDAGRIDARWATTVALADYTRNNSLEMGVCNAQTLDFLIGTGNSFSGTDTLYREVLSMAVNVLNPPTVLKLNNSAGLTNHLSYDAMPGNEHGYGFDFARVGENSTREMIQCSRGYNYMAWDVNFAGGALSASDHHWAYTHDQSPIRFVNARGRLFTDVAEDGTFADFDQDGHMDALLATSIYPSPTHPGSPQPQTFDSVVLRSAINYSLQPFFLHSLTQVPALGGSPTATLPVDEYIDVDTRRQVRRPTSADRAVVVDLDNDGYDDAITRLFPIFGVTPGGPAIPLLGTDGLVAPYEDYSVGWRYLRNVITTLPALHPWFVDMGANKMHDSSGGFSVNWNRPIGFDLLADFDNNGACDYFSAVGYDNVVGTGIAVKEQGDDLLFMNGVAGQPVGDLVEQSTSRGITRRYAVSPAQVTTAVAAGGAAQGDIDNDGYADLVVTAYNRFLWIEVLMNRFRTTGKFVNEHYARVPTAQAALSPLIHSTIGVPSGPYPANSVQDDAKVPLLVDLDGDGDLDLIYAVKNNVPRIYRNRGVDSNGDGFIDQLDSSPPGTFEDVTSLYIDQIRPIVDAVDAQAVDLDDDGDFDIFFNTFDDEVVPMRNDLRVASPRPAITEAWPRVGCVKERLVTLEGSNLSGVAAVEFRCRSTGATVTVGAGQISQVANGRIQFKMPAGLKGLCQMRVKNGIWSTQYFGYFALGT